MEKTKLVEDFPNECTVDGGRVIQKNSFGTTYQARCGIDDGFVLKWNTFGSEKEIHFQRQAAQHGLSVPVLEVWKCTAPFSQSSGFIMPLLDQTLASEIVSVTPEQLAYIKQYIYPPLEALIEIKSRKKETIQEKITQIEEDYDHAQTIVAVNKVYEKITILYHKYKWDLPLLPTLSITDDVTRQRSKQDAVFQVKRLLDRLNEVGIHHGDAHLDNFMSKDQHYYAIDFGNSSTMTEYETESSLDSAIRSDHTLFQDSLEVLVDELRHGYPIQLDLHYLLDDFNKTGMKRKKRSLRRKKSSIHSRR